MSRVKKIISMALIFSYICSMTSMASTSRRRNVGVPQGNTVFLTEGQTYSQDVELSGTRGAILSSCTVILSNAGGGAIGIYADIRAHEPIDWGFLTVFLDKWSEEKQIWQMQEMYEMEMVAADDPDGRFTTMTMAFDETNYPPGNYYRLRGIHEVEKDGQYAVMNTRTEGLLITSTP